MSNERLIVRIWFNSPCPGEGETSTSSIAFGWDEAQKTKAKMWDEVEAEGLKPFDAEIMPTRAPSSVDIHYRNRM